MVRRAGFALSVVLLAAQAAAAGELKGIVTAPDGLPVPLAELIAKNTATGKAAKAISTSTGAYSFANLPAGTYDLAVTSIRYLAPLNKAGVTVDATGTAKFDVKLGYLPMGGVPGEGQDAALSSLRRVAPKGKTPRTADGHVDFSGVWSWPVTIDKGTPEWLPAGMPNGSLTPATYCLPHAVLWYNQFVKFVQTPKLMIELYDDDEPAYRQIYLDGRPHPKNEDPTWYGHSVGHWEGDTLVIDRVGFNAIGWLDGDGHHNTEALHVVERMRRPDYGHLEVSMTFEDPAVLKAPWTVTRLSILAPEEDVKEYACNENNVDPPHMVVNKK